MNKSFIADWYDKPFMELLYSAHEIHREYHTIQQLELAAAISVKTGGCSENCGYCPQSAHFKTFVDREKPLSKEEILELAKEARSNGAKRVCFGAAWKSVPNGPVFDELLESAKIVQDLGLSVCGSLGMLSESQASRLLEAGCTEYNCNIDTSERFYPKIITSRTYRERMGAIKRIQKQGLDLCCGGILAMGETKEDIVDFIHTLTQFDPKPKSVPINILVPVEGTPVGDSAPGLDVLSVVRAIATLRIALPKTVIGLAAGRQRLTEAEQAMCFYAGINKIWIGKKILTTSLPGLDQDHAMLEKLGMPIS